MKYAILAYVAWGFFPAFWKLLGNLSATEILCHRIVWSVVFYCAVLLYRRQDVLGLFKQNKKIWARMGMTSLLLFCNWMVYIYAVNSGRVIESSLGYFVTPLVNVGLGVFVLQERLTRLRWTALGLAVIGVLWLSVQAHAPPWIALILAFSFGLYGLIRKITPVDSVRGGQMESLLMLIPSYLVAAIWHADFQFPSYSMWDLSLLAASGAITGLPLIWFAEAAQIIPLNLLGFIQYISPIIQFLLGLVVYHEPFGKDHFVGFIFIWLALSVFAFDLLSNHRKPATVA